MSISVTAPSRIHFGLFGGKNEPGHSFGGLGVMLDRPGLSLTIEPSSELRFTGLQVDRLKQFANKWREFTGCSTDASFHLNLIDCPESHIGLGTGTQLGLAVAAGLFQFFYSEVPAIEVIAESVGRGKRSGVGTYGFLHGGMIVDRGKKKNENLASLDLHVRFPEKWCFVLIKANTEIGLSGGQEESFFSDSEEDLIGKRNQLIGLAKDRIIPAVINSQFEAFSHALYEFGKTSGSYFSKIQGGAFNGRRITEIIGRLRELGVLGVGQSSWGPTIYAAANSEEAANRISESMSIHLTENESMFVAGRRRDVTKIKVHSILNTSHLS